MTMLGFLTFGTTLTFMDLALKNQIEAQDAAEFPKDLKESKGWIRLYRNHNPGFSFGFFKEWPKAVEMIPLCFTSALAGAWTYLMGRRGRFVEKLALTLALAGGISNLYDRMKRGYVVDYFSIQWKALKKVVFNLGDIFILTGAALTVLVEFVDLIRDMGNKGEEG